MAQPNWRHEGHSVYRDKGGQQKTVLCPVTGSNEDYVKALARPKAGMVIRIRNEL